jgi:hypothetical protein
VLAGDAQFGQWTYRIARTGRTITGTATDMIFVSPNTLQAVQIDAIGVLMNANLDTDKAKGKAKVTDRANGGRLLIVTDTVRGGGC